MDSLPPELWWCPACNRGLGNDHRRCVCQAFHFDGTAWENACKKAGFERSQKYLIQLTKGSDTWIKRSHRHVILPPGTYYIGDICYAMRGPEYHEVFGGAGYTEGCYTNGEKVFVVAGTAYGDGTYRGSNGLDYNVDAGVIGIVSKNLFEDEKDVPGGSVHTFTDPVEVHFDESGVFKFVSGSQQIIINTGCVDTYD